MGAYALQRHARPRVDAVNPHGGVSFSKLVNGSYRLAGAMGSSFPGVEDFFAEAGPTVQEESSYREAVASLDPRATLSDNGCYSGDARVFQIGGFAELLNNQGGNRDCPVCGSEMFLLLTAPNDPVVFPCWLGNYVLALWACVAHPEQSSLAITCAKYG